MIGNESVLVLMLFSSIFVAFAENCGPLFTSSKAPRCLSYTISRTPTSESGDISYSSGGGLISWCSWYSTPANGNRPRWDYVDGPWNDQSWTGSWKGTYDSDFNLESPWRYGSIGTDPCNSMNSGTPVRSRDSHSHEHHRFHNKPSWNYRSTWNSDSFNSREKRPNRGNSGRNGHRKNSDEHNQSKTSHEATQRKPLNGNIKNENSVNNEKDKENKARTEVHNNRENENKKPAEKLKDGKGKQSQIKTEEAVRHGKNDERNPKVPEGPKRGNQPDAKPKTVENPKTLPKSGIDKPK